MTYKRRSNYIPLTYFVEKGSLPKKTLRRLRGFQEIATLKCGVCGAETQKLFKAKSSGKGGRLVCTNPACEVYGVIVSV